MREKLRIVLLVFAFYHIAVTLLVPNPKSIATQQFLPFFKYYSNTLGLNTTWQFFSPDPSQNMYFPYEIQVGSGEDPVSGVWPPPPDTVPKMLLENYRRLVYHSLYTTFSNERIENFLVPYLCKKAQNPISINIQTVIEDIPPLESAMLDDKKFVALRKEVRDRDREYPCPN